MHLGKCAGLPIVVCLLLLYGCQQPAASPQSAAMPPPTVTVAQPVRQEVIEWDEFTGHVEAMESVDIRARVSGYLQQINFKAGAKVKRGDLLFVIDPRPFEAELSRAQAELRRLTAALDLARDDFRRAERLFKVKGISEEEYDTRRNGLREATAGLDVARAAVRLAQLNVEFAHIRAPINGRITREVVTEGNLVNGDTSQATQLATIVSVDPVYVYFDADEQSVLKYRRLAQQGMRTSERDMHIEVEMALADEQGFPHKGFIDYVDPRADAATGTVRARGVFPNANDQISPGFFARVRIPGSGRYSALLIDDKAIGLDQGRKFVYVVDGNNLAQYRPLTLGPLINGMRVVKAGLNDGERIVVNGLQRVRPGMTVQPQVAEQRSTGNT